MFFDLLRCDSVTVWQSNEIVRLHGELHAREATIGAYGEMFELQSKTSKIMSAWQDERFFKEREEKQLHQKLFLGIVFVFTILFIAIR